METTETVQSTIEPTGSLERRLSVSVAADRVEEALDKGFRDLNRRVRLKGFRKGKVPRPILEREYGEEVRRTVVGELIEAACNEAIEAHRLDVVVEPRLIDHRLTDAGTVEFVAKVEVRPTFELAPYEDLELERKVVQVEDQHVEDALEALRQRLAVLEAEEDRVNVEPGDIVAFDMYGFHEGEAVPGASGEGVQIEVGANRFHEEFEKQLVGITRSIKSPVVVTFADDHQDPALAGKTIRFDVTVREIKRKVVPNVDDDMVSELGWEGCSTVDDLKARLRADLEKQAERDADRRLRGELVDRLVEDNRFDVPPTMIDHAIARLAYDMGVSEVPKDKVEELKTALRPRAVRQVKAGFVLDAIAYAESLAVTKEEMEGALRQQLIAAGDRVEDVKKYYSRPAAMVELHTALMREKAVERTVELSRRRDVKTAESRVADQG